MTSFTETKSARLLIEAIRAIIREQEIVRARDFRLDPSSRRAKKTEEPSSPARQRSALAEMRNKPFARVMRQVYGELPEFVFRDMYGHEKQWSNYTDPDIGSKVRELSAAVMRGDPHAIENFREFERSEGRESGWIDTVWSKRPVNVKLRWHDLTASKRDFFKEKYTGNNPHFSPRTPNKDGYLDKLERLLSKPGGQAGESAPTNEPVLLLQNLKKDELGYDVIGGNNRTFAAFFILAADKLKITTEDINTPATFNKLFDFLDQSNPAIQINAYTGSKVG